RLRDILPDAAQPPVMGLPDYGALFPDLPMPEAPPEPPIRHALYPVAEPGMAGASNAFAASAHRAAGGAPLLATDPHLPLSAPSIWMLARMDLAEGPVIGGTIPRSEERRVGKECRSRWAADH